MPRYQLAVEVDHSRLAPFAPIERSAQGSIDLRPIEPDQTRAIVRVFAVSEQRTVELTRFDVTPLPQHSSAQVHLRLRARIDDDNRARLRLEADNRVVARHDMNIRRYLGGPSPLRITAAVALLLLIGGGVFLLLQRPWVGSTDDTGGADTAQELGSDTAATGADAEAAPEEEPPPEPEADGSDTAEPDNADATAQEETAPDGGGVGQPDEPSPDAKLAERTWNVYFSPDSPALTDAARNELSTVAEALNEAESIEVSLVGHTALFGTEQGRTELSRERARRTQAYLEERVTADGVTFNSTGVGGSSPVTRNEDEQHRNRRVEISVTDLEE